MFELAGWKPSRPDGRRRSKGSTLYLDRPRIFHVTGKAFLSQYEGGVDGKCSRGGLRHGQRIKYGRALRDEILGALAQP